MHNFYCAFLAPAGLTDDETRDYLAPMLEHCLMHRHKQDIDVTRTLDEVYEAYTIKDWRSLDERLQSLCLTSDSPMSRDAMAERLGFERQNGRCFVRANPNGVTAGWLTDEALVREPAEDAIDDVTALLKGQATNRLNQPAMAALGAYVDEGGTAFLDCILDYKSVPTLMLEHLREYVSSRETLMLEHMAEREDARARRTMLERLRNDCETHKDSDVLLVPAVATL